MTKWKWEDGETETNKKRGRCSLNGKRKQKNGKMWYEWKREKKLSEKLPRKKWSEKTDDEKKKDQTEERNQEFPYMEANWDEEWRNEGRNWKEWDISCYT